MSVASKSSPNPEKGKRYIALLDQALCNASWAEVPELARKVDKHAPERKCLTLTARSEAQIALASQRPSSASAPGTSTTVALAEATPKLELSIERETQHLADAYCARTCLAEIYWRRESPSEALAILKHPIDSPIGNDESTPALGWQEVCAAKSAFIKAAAYEALGQKEDLNNLYRRASTQTPGSRTPELRRWTQKLLGRACVYNAGRTQEPTLEIMNDALRSFRSWDSFCQRGPASLLASENKGDQVDQRQVWKTYYSFLSAILQRGLVYIPSPDGGSDHLVLPSRERHSDASLRQRAEIKRVEATYESLLLSESKFPTAHETNTEVEQFVEQVISNWRIFCSSNWTDSDLGDGGREGVSRGVLDILYRAATRTFHSTAILRQLFTVHASIGEFDLAMHAFNSYEDIMDKGKARAEKTGKHELGLDSDDTAIVTAAEAVRILCRYGDRLQAQKALEISKVIQQWLKSSQTSSNSEAADAEESNGVMKECHLQGASLAAAYRAIGISQAHWALLTFEPEVRSGLQANAVENLRLAQTHDANSIQTAYALAKVLAERREVPAAIQVLKKCIAVQNQLADEDDDLEEQTIQRALIPLWYLLALCLASRDEYEAASKMCDAAFDQFENPITLFGDLSYLDSSKYPRREKHSQGLADQMDSFEKETILQIKTSRLTFVELMEGATFAVDLTNELLAMYSRLFGTIELQPQEALQAPSTALTRTPSKIGVNLRSIAGSIRQKSGRSSAETEAAKHSANNALPSLPPTRAGEGHAIGAPISITVTNEDGISAEKSSHHHHPHLPFKFKKNHNEANATPAIIPGATTAATEDSLPPNSTEIADHALVHATANNSVADEEKSRADWPLKDTPHNLPHDDQPLPLVHDEQAPHQGMRLPAPRSARLTGPETRFASLEEYQHKTTVLVRTWLFIAGLYLRADLHDDAQGALEEAARLVESFEVKRAHHDSSAKAFFNQGWGGGSSVDALWADVYSAKADLSLARNLPFDAASNYEQALIHYPDHPAGIVGLSNLLMDIFEEKMPAEEPVQPLVSLEPILAPLAPPTRPAQSRPATAKSSIVNVSLVEEQQLNGHKDPTPAELNRLAARDRAYMLLSNLTKLGTGWNDPEAWLTLARSHELSGQIGKAKQALWWVVELEDSKPIRPWSEAAAGGYAL
ncbi:Hypothetical protein R9X50_00022800 [Acrodontium crateriforme]|uniref:Filamentation protein n=1 Tax=Acrodontium crateriforme TaxID=150365 RepID=A0AAQ3LWW5_9PEZI|nr:Hypothetical protein R9X50_00022800 [Acrodontium crateriforme]